MRSPDKYCDAIYSTAYRARLCPDVVLKAFGKAYPSHRIILASQSAYFATLLRWVVWVPTGASASDPWSGLPCHELVLGEDVTQRGFEWILEYFYASPHVSITSDNAFDVLAAAHYLGVTTVQTACVEFLAQHLEPHNLAACLLWATRADHDEASEMLAASCRRLLALRLPSNLTAWAPALVHIEPRTLLDIMSSDHLAVPTEFDRYNLVKEVANICAAAAAGPSATAMSVADTSGARQLHGVKLHDARLDGGAAGGDHVSNAPDENRAVVGGAGTATVAAVRGISSRAAAGTLEVRRMLSSALRLDDEGLTGHLQLARSSSPAGVPRPEDLPAAPADQAGMGDAAAAAAGQLARSRLRPWSSADLRSRYACVSGGLRSADIAARLTCGGSPAASAAEISMSESACTEGSSLLTSSQASSRSTFPLFEGAGGGGVTTEDRVVNAGASGTAGTGCEAAAAPPLPPHLPPRAAAAAHTVEIGDEGATAAVNSPTKASSPGATMAAAAAAAASSARLLLQEAVRYEHLTVPQLMAVKREGLVAADVLHAALWERTRLDFEIHSRGSRQHDPWAAPSERGSIEHHAAAAATPALGGLNDDGKDGDVRQLGSMQAAAVEAALFDFQGPEPGNSLRQQLRQEPRLRAFRLCWRLECGALKKLKPKDMLQSDMYQHAGALWQLRLCCSDRSGGHLGLFLGRHLATTAAGGSAVWGPGAQGGLASPARQPQLDPGFDAGGGPAQQRHHRQPRRRPPPPPQQQPLPGPEQQLLPQEAPKPFFAFTDHSSLLRGRCRVSVFQSDNTALQGRLCLGDTGDFTADFAAGGYFGQGQLIARADLSQLPDEQEVLVFMVLQVLVEADEHPQQHSVSQA